LESPALAIGRHPVVPAHAERVVIRVVRVPAR
jgi:hypothetical protein